MTEFLPILALVLIGGRLAATFAGRFGMPGVFGELLLGLAVGPIIVRQMTDSSMISDLGQIGVLMLMLLVGLETDLSVVKTVGKRAFLVAFLGAILPTVFGYLIASGLGEPDRVALFIGVALSATSVSITAATLRELGRLNGTAGQTILVAAVLDDILVLLLIAMVGGSGSGSPGMTALKVTIYLILAIGGGVILLRPILSTLSNHVEEFLAVAIGLALLYAWTAESFAGLAGVSGAYIAGLLLARAMPEAPLAKGVETLATGFFATLFFVSLGLNVDAHSVSLLAVAGMTVLAIVTKLVGCGGGAFLSGMSKADSLAIGVGMIPRGEVALIVAGIGFDRGILGTGIFSELVLVVIATTVITPVLLRVVFSATDRIPKSVHLPTPVFLSAPYASSEGSD
jgi:Kef-type K+ transport system membrane component KefB